jgi:hypothetical protein
VLAYVFWHRRRAGVAVEEYEAALRAFHSSLTGVRSASFRVDALPFAAGEGYEDWYLVSDWAALGELNSRAVDERHRAPHDSAASRAGAGWGGVYGLVRGEAEPPEWARWVDKPPGTPYEAFIESLAPRAAAVWQRQMVLGPAPEFCVAAAGEIRRERIAGG